VLTVSVLRRLRSDESGFSLTELLVSMLVGSVVLWGAMQIYITGMNQSLRVNDRVEATQRARLAIDRMSSLLDSQVCLAAGVPPIITGSDGNTVGFHADLNGGSNQPRKYELRYDPAARTITERSFAGTGTLPGTMTYPAVATSTRVLATNILPARDSAGTALPIFSYLTFEGDGTIDPAKPLTTPLLAADAAKVVRVGTTFQALPSRAQQADRRATVLQAQGQVASAEPTLPTAGPNCS
jgi:prepilin-type N-terminal cleavage/methylation domain-containing protein